MRRSLRWGLLTVLVLWHLLMVVVLLATGPHAYVTVLVLGHLAAIALGAWTVRDPRVPPALVVALSYALLVSNWWAAPTVEAPVTFATNWFGNLVVATAAFLLPGRWGIAPAFLGPMVGLSVAWQHPEWSSDIPLAAGFTPVMMTLIIVRARSYLDHFAGQADEAEAEADRQRSAARSARIAQEEAAELARTLHDTVINTLGVLAQGGRFLDDRERVRTRCAADADVVQALLDEDERSLADLDDPLDWAALADRAGLSLGPGARTAEAEAALMTVAPSVRTALARAMREVLQNVAEHAGVPEVGIGAVTSRRDGSPAVTVTVTDRGVGFDPDEVVGTGLRESVLARCRAAGVGVRIASRPGAGTTVTFEVPVGTPPVDGEAETAPSDLVGVAQRRSGWLWAGGVIVVGVVIELVNLFGQWSLTWAMLGVAALLVAVAALACRGGRPLTGPAAWVVVAGSPTVFLLALAGIEFTYGNTHHWQTLGVTVPLALLLFFAPSRPLFAVALAAVVTAGLVSWVVLAAEGAPYAGSVPIGLAASCAVLLALAVFRDTIARTAAAALASRRDAAAAAAEVEARRAAGLARLRWRAAGLHGSWQILHSVGTGAVDVTEDRVRASCADEERHLRQLLMLSPELVHLGPVVSAAVRRARERSVRLVLRTSEVDAPDTATARLLGAVIASAIDASAPDGDLVVSVFGQGDRARLFLVGDASIAGLPDPGWPPGFGATEVRHGDQVMVEVSWPLPPQAIMVATRVPDAREAEVGVS